MKRVRIMLRVSSNQQLEADGDLSIQRKIVEEYIEKNPEWELDQKEYFEGSSSGYKKSVLERDILIEAYQDAVKGEYDILVAYKDDRIGRRMWEIGHYIMSLKSLGVDIYTVKDGCISPETDDIMGQMMLALRYGNAQKSSSDTGMRVKDTAKKLVVQGKFMGGRAPYGYRLELSGEISKHGRALKHLVIEPRQAEVVQYIYQLSLEKEYGSVKIANILNENSKYKKLAPNDIWKSGTVSSILTNPIYMGHTAYKRREKKSGKYHRADFKDWILSAEPQKELVIIEKEIWNQVQYQRQQRNCKYHGKAGEDSEIKKKNRKKLPLLDILYCEYCGGKMINGSKYNYWTIKETGERKKSKTLIYRCGNEKQGINHNIKSQYKAEQIESIVFKALAEYIESMFGIDDILENVLQWKNSEIRLKERILRAEEQKLDEIHKDIKILEDHLPKAMTDQYPISVEKLVQLIEQKGKMEEKQQELIMQQEAELYSKRHENGQKHNDFNWEEVILNADIVSKRILADRLIEYVGVKMDEIRIRFKKNILKNKN